MSDRDRDRAPKSWRDIDSSRDKPRPAASSSPGDFRGPRDADRASKQHRAALEALFAKGEIGKLADKLGAPGARLTLPSLTTATPGNGTADPAPPAAAAPVEAAGAVAVAVAAAPARAVAAAATPVEASPKLALRKKVVEAIGRDPISKAFDKYVAEFGIPNDFELLEQGLEHTRDARVDEVLGALEKLLEKEKPKRSRALAGKLRFLEETSDDADLRTRAGKLRAKLG